MSEENLTRCVFIPPVRCFSEVYPDKAHALKVLEEAAEVFGAWQYAEACGVEYADPDTVQPDGECYEREEIIKECADVIQATCNLLYALGVTDMAQPMGACEQRNRERGRI